ncbi:Acyl-CoA N-acyltransferases (Nat) [Glarea lozoyensis ATCC 20868]|uniref:Acyl-CoA N-acyltransferases (Nat) n=1 Tax=Glarea lozoyensis (strain ATCC 20868 / MF5171) TaxID=1116229 RepID=S3DDA5_GLAL2|nr:Acyl-CoA N-acyltransferases (Nat) [Glarea lozoyensis ATCC 20868]EPE36377.1 Acyl-CoA N-acyltransferases (Nat) [Glarea lozoyensis ATCC 20868]
MPFHLLPSSDTDMSRTFEIISTTFGNQHPYIEAVYPAHSTPEGRKRSTERLLAVKNTDPCCNFLKVVDTASGKIVAVAKWNIYDDHIPEEADLDGDWWENEEEKEFARVMYREYLVPRRRAIGELKGNVMCLDLLTVDPEYQRRGVGRMLVQWGTLLADDIGLTAVVESTDPGRGLYESEGFVYVDTFETKFPEKWEGRRKQKFHWMVRPCKVGRTD